MLHQFAVVKALDDLKPPTEKDDIADHLTPWLNDLRLSQNAIDTILSLPPRNATLENARFENKLVHYVGKVPYICIAGNFRLDKIFAFLPSVLVGKIFVHKFFVPQ